MLALRASAALMWLVALGFGAPTPYAAVRLLRDGKLPTFIGMFPMYGGGFFERASHRTFVAVLGLFALLCVVEGFAGWQLWQGARLGAWMTILLLPIEIVFWAGFALPIPPTLAVVRLVLLAIGWSALSRG